MKTLLLIRHAKSSWKEPHLADFDRPLNNRGKRDVPVMAHRIQDNKIQLDHMVSSPAKRALDTAKGIALGIDFDPSQIERHKDLYMASERDFLLVIGQTKNHVDTLAVFSHNPGITAFANKLGRLAIENVPTCGMVRFSLPITDWKQIDQYNGQLIEFDYPKKEKRL